MKARTSNLDDDRWQRSLLATLGVADGAGTWSSLGRSAASSTFSLIAGSARYFVKVAASDERVLFAEAEALATIAATGALRVPRVVAHDRTDGRDFLVLEWLDLADGGRDGSLGAALARMHAVTLPHFGWHRDNTIGATPQANGWSDDWPDFFRERRLRPQLALAMRNGHERSLLRDAERVLERIPDLLSGHRPAASLLHGDLWSGNAGRLRDGTPVVFDPSTYYGDRETDIAMTALFGGFDASFHAAYAALMPLPPGHEKRRTLYNLYHVLNHVNLFGASYLPLARRMIAELLG